MQTSLYIWRHLLQYKENHVYVYQVSVSVSVSIYIKNGIKIWWLTNFYHLVSSYLPKPVYCSYFYLNFNQCSSSVSWQFSFVALWKNWFVDSPCWDLTNQYDYFSSQCSCVCITKTAICVWDIVREEGVKNKWMKGRSLIYGHVLDFKYLVHNKMKQWKEQKSNEQGYFVAWTRIWLEKEVETEKYMKNNSIVVLKWPVCNLWHNIILAGTWTNESFYFLCDSCRAAELIHSAVTQTSYVDLTFL